MEPGSGVAETRHFVCKIKKKSFRGTKISRKTRLLLDLLCCLSPNNSQPKAISVRRDFLRHFLPLLYLTLNHLAYLPLQPLQAYTGTARAWKGVLWLRLDYIVVEIGLQRGCLYALWVVIGVLVGLICVLVGQLAASKVPFQRVKELFQFLLLWLWTLFPLPAVHLLMADFLTSVSAPSASLAFETVSVYPALSAISLGALALLVLLREIAALEALCHPKYWRPGPRSSLSAPVSDLISLLLSPFLYFTVPSLNVYFYYGLFSLLHSLLAAFYYFQLPMYNETANLVHISCHLALSWGGVAMLIGELIASDYTAVMLLLVVTPALLYLLQNSWPTLYLHVLSAGLEDCHLPQSRNSVTLIVRTVVLQGKAETVRQTFRSLRVGSYRQQVWIGVLEASFSLQVQRDERQARLQLAESREKVKVGWVDTFLRYKLWQSLQLSSVEEVAYLHFLRTQAKVHSTDEGLCRDLTEFWSELASQDPKRSKVNSLMDRIAVQIGTSKRLYEGMLAASPDNPALLESYTAFLRDILLKPEKASLWETKARIVRETHLRQGDAEMAYGQEGTGVLVVDLSSEDAGQILYCNEEAADILLYDGMALGSMKFYSLLPQPYASLHSGHFLRFGSLRNSLHLPHPQVLPLVTSQGFILEVTTKVAFTCLGGAVLLVLGYKRANTNREIAIITSEGLITATTQGFPRLLGSKAHSLLGESLYSLCPKLFFAQEIEENVQIRASPSVFGAVSTQLYGATEIRFAELYAGNNDAHMRSLAEATRRSSIDKLRNLSSANTLLYSSHQSMEKGDLAPFMGPSGSNLAYRLKDRPKKKGFSGGNSTWSIKSASTGQELLVKGYIKQGLNRAYMILGSVAGLITLLMLVWTTAISLYLIIVTQGVIDDSVARELSERIVHTTRIAGQGRFLDLTNAGFFPEYMTKDVKNVVFQSITTLTAIEQKVWATLQSLPDGPFKDLMLEDKVLTWELNGGVPRPHKRNLVNAMKVFLDHSRQLLDLPLSDLSIHNPSVFFLVRNGMQGEFARSLSLSLSLFTDIEQVSIAKNVSSILYLLISVFLSLGIAMVISVPVIMRLQVYVTKVSAVFTSLPLARCLENKRTVVDRLRYRFGVELEYGVERPKRQERDFLIYRPVGRLVFLMIGFLCLSAVLYLVLYFDRIVVLTEYVRVLPNLMQLYALRFAGLLDLWTWTVEIIFSASTWPLSQALPSLAPQLTPGQVIALTGAYLRRVSLELLVMNGEGYLPYSPAHIETFLYHTNYTTPLLQKGIRSGLVMYGSEIRVCAGYRGVSEEMYKDCGDLYSAAREMVNVSSDVFTFVREDFKIEVLSKAWVVNYWLLVWAACSLFFLVVCLLPMMYKSRRHVMRMIALGRLVRETAGSKEASTNI